MKQGPPPLHLNPKFLHLHPKSLHRSTFISSPKNKSTPTILKSKLPQHKSDPSLSLPSHDSRPLDRRSSTEQSSDQTCNGRFILCGTHYGGKGQRFPNPSFLGPQKGMFVSNPNPRRFRKFERKTTKGKVFISADWSVSSIKQHKRKLEQGSWNEEELRKDKKMKTKVFHRIPRRCRFGLPLSAIVGMEIDYPPKISFLKRGRSDILVEGEHDKTPKKFKRGKTVKIEDCVSQRNLALVFHNSEMVSMETLFSADVEKVEVIKLSKENNVKVESSEVVIWGNNDCASHVRFGSSPHFQTTNMNVSLLFGSFSGVDLYAGWNLLRKPNLGFLANLNPLLQIYDSWQFQVNKISHVWFSVWFVIIKFIMVMSWFYVFNNGKGWKGVHNQWSNTIFYTNGFKISSCFPLEFNQALVLASVVSRLPQDGHPGTTLFLTPTSKWALPENHLGEDVLWLNVASFILLQWFNNISYHDNNPDGITLCTVCEREGYQLWNSSSISFLFWLVVDILSIYFLLCLCMSVDGSCFYVGALL